MTNHIYYTAAVVAKQKRRADLDIEQRLIKRNILRKTQVNISLCLSYL